MARFHNPNEEITKGYDVVPQLSDDIQLTVDEYRKKLYEVRRASLAFSTLRFPSV